MKSMIYAVALCLAGTFAVNANLSFGGIQKAQQEHKQMLDQA